MIIDITSDTHELSAEKIITDGTEYCEYGHKITQPGKIAWKDDADVIVCQRHMITQLKSIMTDD